VINQVLQQVVSYQQYDFLILSPSDYQGRCANNCAFSMVMPSQDHPIPFGGQKSKNYAGYCSNIE